MTQPQTRSRGIRLHATRARRAGRWRALAAIALAAAGCLAPRPIAAAPPVPGTISGRVTDPAGMPIEGASVSIKRGPSAVTDAGGGYLLDGVKPGRRIKILFSKEGYVPTLGIGMLLRRKDGGRPSATFDRTLLPAGPPHPLPIAQGGTVAEEGFQVTFPANAFQGKGSVDVVVSPIDVSTGEFAAFPGSFNARTEDGTPAVLETFSLMEVTVLRDGKEVNLKRGATATLEVLLPADTPLADGETVPLWYLNGAGKSIEEGSGTVGMSSSTPGRLALTGTVAHFSWWNVDRPIGERTCLAGVVLDSSGAPVAGASVRASGMDYNGTTSAVTDEEGRYCVEVKRGSTVSVEATVFAGFSASAATTVVAPDAAARCGVDDCEPVADLVLPATSCVSGDVRDEAGDPVAGVTVTASTGGFAVTDAAGAYCLDAPSGAGVTVQASGFEPATVTTPGSASACPSGPCAAAPIRPPASDACLDVTVTDAFGNPVPSAPVEVYDLSGNLLAQGTTDGSGQVCLGGVPALIDVRAHATDGSGETGDSFVNTGSGGGSCGGGGCVAVAVVTGAPAS